MGFYDGLHRPVDSEGRDICQMQVSPKRSAGVTVLLLRDNGCITG